MKFLKYINESSYNNWIFPDNKTILADFQEYKKKEFKKWENRANIIGSRFPIFNDLDHFKKDLKDSNVITLTKSIDTKIMNRSHTKSIDNLKDLVNGYYRPRDVDRIVKGFNNNDKIPYPIVLKGNKAMWIMAGNTRLDSAFILDIKPKVLLVDVRK